jgi:lysophospholipid acyltransferase (LPLAT)-like uncharacterized protein
MHWTRSLKYKILNMLVPVLYGLLRVLGCTLRKRHTGQEQVEAFLREDRGGIGAFLHCDLASMALWGIEMARRGRPVTVLTSPSRDGQIFARFVRKLGVRTVKGSSSRGGAQGMLALVRALREGHHIGIVVDGPRGPRGTVKPGVIWLAQRSGAPIFPVAARVRPTITLPTWDRAEIPVPFARYEFIYGNKWIPPENTEDACRKLEETLRVLKAHGLTRANTD